MSDFMDDIAILFPPKTEPDSSSSSDSSDSDSDSNWPSLSSIPIKNSSKLLWSHADTTELIKLLSTECQELWDPKHSMYRDKLARSIKQEYLAKKFKTSSEEIVRKIHNLRTQFNAEVRKIKRHRARGLCETETKRWEYFESLMFLQPDALSQNCDDIADDLMDPLLYNLPTPSTSAEPVNVNYEAEEDVVFRRNQDAPSNADAQKPETSDACKELNRKRKKLPKTKEEIAMEALARLVQTKFPLPLAESEPRRYAINRRDDCQIFGDFVATELRCIRNLGARTKLRRMIMTSILRMGREDV